MIKKIVCLLMVLAFIFGPNVTVLAEEPARQLKTEPTIRVGLSKSARSFVFAASSTYRLISDGRERLTINPGDQIEIRYQNRQYVVGSATSSFSLPGYLRFVPDSVDGVFSLLNYERRFDNGPTNYNKYRGVLEYRYSPLSKLPYFINELPLEQYLYGIAEVAKGDPVEYVKAMVIAARSYAYTHMGAPISDKNMFDVFGSTNDQLYLGYVSELNHPNVVDAANSSIGEMVVYKSSPINAVYFGQSNGKTKSWPKSKGDRPWLISVVAKYDKGHRLWGHGYGISMHDARERAVKDGWTHDQILGYYYSSTTIEKVY